MAPSGTVGAAFVLSEQDATMAHDFCRKVRLRASNKSVIALLPLNLAPRIGLRAKLLEAGADLCLASSTSSCELSARLCSQMRLNLQLGLRQLYRGSTATKSAEAFPSHRPSRVPSRPPGEAGEQAQNKQGAGEERRLRSR